MIYAFYEYRGVKCHCRRITNDGYTSRSWCIKEFPDGTLTREIRNYPSSIFTIENSLEFENLFIQFI